MSTRLFKRFGADEIMSNFVSHHIKR